MSRLLIVVPALLALSGSPAPTTCVFHPDSHGWSGSCNPTVAEATTLSIARADSITTGTWRSDARPAVVWAGGMTDSSQRNSPIEIEVYTGGSGVLRTEAGWFAISGFVSSPQELSLIHI